MLGRPPGPSSGPPRPSEGSQVRLPTKVHMDAVLEMVGKKLTEVLLRYYFVR